MAGAHLGDASTVTYAESTDDLDGVPLRGGNTNADVRRVGDTVRRATGPWTDAVHALLQHLAEAGFTAAPRALGRDVRGREVLTYLPGEVVYPDHQHLLAESSALASVTRIIRRYHDVVASFAAPAGAVWQNIAADPTGAGEVICHNDFAPWNLVANGEKWAFIDWDLAAPGRRYWDLAWAFQTLVGMWPDAPDDVVGRRFAAACTGYGVPREDWDLVMRLIVDRTRWEADRITIGARRGEDPLVRLYRDGHANLWRSASENVAQRRTVWLRLAGAPRPST
jgi:hypothetical protein